jgi:hypothetical protein
VPRRRALLERRQVGLHHAAVGVDREEERDVHVDALGEQRAHRAGPALRARHLDHDVRPVDGRPEPAALLDGGVGVVGDARGDLDAHVAVGAAGGVVHAAELVAGGLHVVHLDRLEQLPRAQPLARGAQLLVVRLPLRERLLEDRRVGGHAGEGLVADAALEAAVEQHAAVDVVEPDALAGGVEGVQAVG